MPTPLAGRGRRQAWDIDLPFIHRPSGRQTSGSPVVELLRAARSCSEGAAPLPAPDSAPFPEVRRALPRAAKQSVHPYNCQITGPVSYVIIFRLF